MANRWGKMESGTDFLFLGFSWTARRSKHSILKEINRECSLEGLMLMLQYFDHNAKSLLIGKKTLMLGKIEGRRRGATEDEIVR